MLGDEIMAAALIDRLLHHCHIVNIRGNSYRMKSAPGPAPDRTGEAPRRGGTVVTANLVAPDRPCTSVQFQLPEVCSFRLFIDSPPIRA